MSAKPGNAERDAVAIAGRPWDRQPNESPKAFEAFAVYRDMGYQRSLAAPRRGRCQSRVRSGGIPAASWSATVFAMIRAVS